MTNELEELREKLNKLVLSDEAILHQGEILKISQELDKLICMSYTKSNLSILQRKVFLYKPQKVIKVTLGKLRNMELQECLGL